MKIPDECQRSLDAIVSTARRFLSEGKELQAMAFMGQFGAGFAPIPMDMANKDRSAAFITAICKCAKPDYVIMISEAWALSAQCIGAELERLAKTLESISNHPDRIDVVMITLETKEGNWIAQTPIKSLGGKRKMDDPEFLVFTGIEGRFASFLPRGTQH